jgi:hypothetical protein
MNLHPAREQAKTMKYFVQIREWEQYNTKFNYERQKNRLSLTGNASSTGVIPGKK